MRLAILVPLWMPVPAWDRRGAPWWSVIIRRCRAPLCLMGPGVFNAVRGGSGRGGGGAWACAPCPEPLGAALRLGLAGERPTADGGRSAAGIPDVDPLRRTNCVLSGAFVVAGR